jgi:hypothetical protein
MRQSEYLVIERQSQWWVMLDGVREGPYPSRQIAIDSAILAAKIEFNSGRLGRVSVQNGTEMVTAYDSSSD